MTIKFFFIFILTSYALGYWSQTKSQQLVDFQKELATYKEDTNKVKKIIEFVQSQDELNHSSFKYLQEALRLSNKLRYTEGQYRTNIELCYYFSNVQINNMKAMKAANNAVVVAEKINKPKKLIEAYQLVGHYYRNANKNREAVGYMLKALNVANKTRNAEACFTLDNDLGIAHPNSDTALMFLQKSLRILDSVPNFDTKTFGGRSKKELRSIVLNNMGNVYSRMAKPNEEIAGSQTTQTTTAEKENTVSSEKNRQVNSLSMSEQNNTEKKEHKKKEKTVLKEIYDLKNNRNEKDSIVQISKNIKNENTADKSSEGSKTKRFVILIIFCLAVLLAAFYFKNKKRKDLN